jgi:hypothetical protein
MYYLEDAIQKVTFFEKVTFWILDLPSMQIHSKVSFPKSFPTPKSSTKSRYALRSENWERIIPDLGKRPFRKPM